MTSANTVTPSRFTATTPLAVLGAAGVATGGVLHLLIWNHTYRPIPDGAVPGLWVVKDGFPVNAASSLAIAVALLLFAFAAIARLGRLALLGALGLELSSIGVLLLSKGPGIFGWKEAWTSDAKHVIAVEIATTVVLALTLAVDMRRANHPPNPAPDNY